MQIIKGFGTITQFVNNTPGVTATLGELSSWSRTYSKEKGEYLHPNVQGYEFTSFKAVDSTTGVAGVVSQDQVQQILAVIRECYLYASNHIRPYDPLDFKNTILTSFYGQIANFEFGDFVDNGTVALPEWLMWDSTTYNNNKIKVWLVDQAFQVQYDEYEIVVVPPLSDLDHFFYEFGTVVAELDSLSLPDFMERIQNQKGIYPETYTRVVQYDFVNTLNPAQTHPTNWGVLIYGQQGDNVDNIKDAIAEYVLANSSHTRSQWEQVIPDLFKRTEFTILPRWDLISIPNQTSLSALYKSMLNPKECIQFAKTNISFYAASFIDDNCIVMPYDYKTLMLVSINGDTNVPESAHLEELFPDYLPVPSTSTDFSRMTVRTRNWSLFLEALLITAETATPYTAVPTDQRKQTRDGILFVSGMYENINYLVAARSNTQVYPQS